jgi:hypothetical protein
MSKQGATYVSVGNNAYDPDVANAQPTSLLHQDLLKRDRVSPLQNSPSTESTNNPPQRLKATIRILRVISRTLLTILTLAMTVQEGRTVVTYYQTRNDMQMTPDSSTPRGPWAQQTQVWSSLLLFSTSVVTSLLGVLSVFAYAVSTKTSNAVSSLQTKFGIAVEAVHVLVWVAVAAAYRLARNGNDLWGWSCSLMADNIQPTFEGVVNFGSVCDRSVCFPLF